MSYPARAEGLVNSTSTKLPPSKNNTTVTFPTNGPLSHLSPQQEHFLHKHHRPYKIPLPRSQSAERAQPLSLARTPSLPSLSPSEFSSKTYSLQSPHPKENLILLPEKRNRIGRGMNFQLNKCSGQRLCARWSWKAVGDFQLWKALKPLLNLEKINNKNIANPSNFRSAAMVTTFVRSAGDRTKGVWKFLSTVCQTDTGMKLAELEHSSLKKCIIFCEGRVPILVHPSLYRSLKLRFPIDVGGITRDNRVSTELGTGSLRQAVGILTPKIFRPVVDTE